MQQDNTDKILQRMESQQLPDLSQMDKHWDDMRGVLVAGAIAKPLVSAAAKWMIAATLVSAVTLVGWKMGWFSSGNNKQSQQQEIAKILPTPVLQKPGSVLQDSVFQFKGSQPNFNGSTSNSNNIVGSGNTATPGNGLTLNYYSAQVPAWARSSPMTAYNTTATTFAGTFKKTIPYDSVDAHRNNTYFRYTANVPSEKETEAMNAQLMQQFWSQVEKKPQQFIIDNRQDTKLEGTEGTSITIPANAFPNVGDGKITIELTEFYDYGEMIANKLTTSSYQRQLVSDGMLHIKAMQNGKEIQMTGLKPMDVYMPRRAKNSDMQLFAGEWKNFVGNPKLINWIPMGQQQYNRFRDGSGNAVLEAYAVRKRLFSKKHVVKYALTKLDTLNAGVTRSLIQEVYPDDIIKVKKGEPRFLGLFRKKSFWDAIGKYGDYDYQLPFNTRELNQFGYGVRYSDESGKTDSLRSRYEFSVNTTGWINCDRFMEDPSPKVELAISGNKEEKIYASYLVFKDMKSVLPGYAYNNKCTFYGIPGGKDVTLVTLGISHGKTICSMRDMKTKSGAVTGLQFAETDPEDFKQRLMVLKW